MKLSIIIVNYNVKHFLEQCLHSVSQAIATIDTEVFVVDNASSDGSLEYLQPKFPKVRFVNAEHNLGFGKANNLALSMTNGEFVLFLNPDTIVPEDCFLKCIDFLKNNPKAGAVGVKMIDGSGSFLPESKRSFPTTSTAFFKAVGLSDIFPRSKIFNRYALGYLNEGQDHKVDVLSGAFMFIKSSVLKQSGGFDESFFMYAEDIDLSYRVKQTGFENWYLGDAAIVHFKGESIQKWSAKHVKMFYTGMIIFVKKHYQGKGAALLKLLLIAGIKTKGLLSFLRGGFNYKSSPKTQTVKRVVVIGNEQEVEECLQFYHNSTSKIFGRFSFADNIADLQRFCEETSSNQIIFCSGSIQYKSMIAVMQQLGSTYSYRFHSTNSQCIIGSDSKSDLGEVLTIN